jgi:hypothetical protein
MTETTTEDEVLLDVLDEGLDPVCEFLVGGVHHGVVADWMMLLRCCGNGAPMCDQHRVQTVLMLRLVSSYQCGACKTVMPPISWVPLKAGR